MRGVFRRRPADGALESLRRYTYHTLMWTFVAVGFVLALALVNDAPRDARLVLLVAVGAAVGYWQWRWTTRAITRTVGEMPLWYVAMMLAVALGTAAVAASAPTGMSVWGIAVGLIVHDVIVGRRVERGWRLWLPTGVVVAAIATGVDLARGLDPGTALHEAAIMVGVAALMVYAEHMTLRQWLLATELDQARRDAAELATTRERLRLAEDLHDILGHALEVVSLKAELANRLRDTDPERAGAELTEVQRLARGALTDVRELVQGRRSTTLAAELAGARSLLGSAGITWELTGDPAGVDGAAGELLGRVVREAMTNLLRHANASRCTVTVAATAERPSVRVVNDGVAPMPRPDLAGTGLASLSRRITEAGGTFTAGLRPDPAEFEVYAEVPR